MNEAMLFQELMQTLSGGGGWTYAVYLAAMFVVLMWRKESIVSWGLFRASYLLFAATLVVPAVVKPLVSMSMFSGGLRGGGISAPDANMLLMALNAGLGPGLFAGAVVCGIGSMMPSRIYNLPPPGPPSQHPLD